MISKILVAYDGSEGSERALDFGLDLAEKYSASVLIITVLQLPVSGSPEDPLAGSASIAGLVKDLRKSHEAMLTKAKDRADRIKPNIKAETRLLEGNPPNEIAQIASDGNFSLVVLGHSGKGRFREFLLGGTSERVAHLARCAVLIVK